MRLMAQRELTKLRRGILKNRVFPPKNASNVPGEIWRRHKLPLILDLRLRNTRTGNHVIIVTSSFSKSSTIKMFSVHTKRKSQLFQIPPVWRAFVTLSWRISVDSGPNRINKVVLSNFSGLVRMGRQNVLYGSIRCRKHSFFSIPDTKAFFLFCRITDITWKSAVMLCRLLR